MKSFFYPLSWVVCKCVGGIERGSLKTIMRNIPCEKSLIYALDELEQDSSNFFMNHGTLICFSGGLAKSVNAKCTAWFPWFFFMGLEVCRPCAENHTMFCYVYYQICKFNPVSSGLAV